MRKNFREWPKKGIVNKAHQVITTVRTHPLYCSREKRMVKLEQRLERKRLRGIEGRTIRASDLLEKRTERVLQMTVRIKLSDYQQCKRHSSLIQ